MQAQRTVLQELTKEKNKIEDTRRNFAHDRGKTPITENNTNRRKEDFYLDYTHRRGTVDSKTEPNRERGMFAISRLTDSLKSSKVYGLHVYTPNL
ncbi:UNVERIFIED_CONTAM: hypothetical protein NCL1_43916 [Trichonephila clavipes]